MEPKKSRPSSLKQHSIESLDGYWKVLFHGGIQPCLPSEKTPRLPVYFGRLAAQNNPSMPEDFCTTATKVINVPAAELMRLPLNTVVNNCKIAFDPNEPLPSEQWATFEVTLSRNKMRLINRYQLNEEGEYLFPIRLGRTPEKHLDGGKAYFVAIEQDGNPYGLVIPCSEIFRFFYCTSSKLAYTLLSSRILDPDRFMINPARSGVSEADRSIASIWLRPWMLNSDRRHLARLFFTEGALKEAQQIFLRLSGNLEEEYERCLVAFPPEQGISELSCIYRKRWVAGRICHFVTRIIQTDWSLDFKEIHYGRDNDNERTANKEERELLKEHERESRPYALKPDSEIESLKNDAANDAISEMELMDHDFKERFPELDKIRSPKIPKCDQISRNLDNKQQLQLADGSLVKGDGKVEGMVISTILQSMQLGEDIQKKQEDQDPGQQETLLNLPPIACSKFNETITLIEEAQIRFGHRLFVICLPILMLKEWHRGKIVNVLPMELDNKSYAWFFVDKDKKNPRRVLVAMFQFEDQVRYLFEFMHRETSENGDTAQLVLWAPKNIQIPRQLLEYVILTCMRNKSINLRDGVLLQGLCAAKFRHFRKSDSSPETKSQRYIEKIFGLEDDLNRLLADVSSASCENSGRDIDIENFQTA